jgi:tetratricopeptide (TPR) repeat protein
MSKPKPQHSPHPNGCNTQLHSLAALLSSAYFQKASGLMQSAQQQRHRQLHLNLPSTVQNALQVRDAMRCTVLQVGRSLSLLGKHRAAVEVYDEALRLAADDWELWFNKGHCASQTKDYDRQAARL